MKDGIIDADPATFDTLTAEIVRLEGLIVGLKNTFEENVAHAVLSKSMVDVSELVSYIAKSFNAKAKLNNIRINTYIDEDVRLYTDRDKLSQIIQNLVSNAIKAIGKNGTIEINLTEDEKEIQVSVKDSGIGIKEEDIPRIFDRFYRVEDSRNTKDNGVGLGLAITKNFVLALEGKIRVKSNLGFGSEFNVVFEKNNRMNNDKKKDKHL